MYVFNLIFILSVLEYYIKAVHYIMLSEHFSSKYRFVAVS